MTIVEILFDEDLIIMIVDDYDVKNDTA